MNQLFPELPSLTDWIETLVANSELARREGLLSLEEEIEVIKDPAPLDKTLFRDGMQMIVDGLDPDILEPAMLHALSGSVNRLFQRWTIWRNLLLFLAASDDQGSAQDFFESLLLDTPEDNDIRMAIAPFLAFLNNLTPNTYATELPGYSDHPLIGANLRMFAMAGRIPEGQLATNLNAQYRSFEEKHARALRMIIEGILHIQRGSNPRVVLYVLSKIAGHEYIPAKLIPPTREELMREYRDLVDDVDGIELSHDEVIRRLNTLRGNPWLYNLRPRDD